MNAHIHSTSPAIASLAVNRPAVAKVFLQDCQTAKFIRCDSMWTADSNEALDFLSIRRAVAFGMKELKNSFQIMQVESNALSGVVVIAISNLSWPEGSQSPLSISVAHALPKPDRAPEFSSSLGIFDGRREVRKRGEYPMAI
jgi:hypothetical protein